MKKRILAFVMAVILCVGLLPVGVMAEEFNGEEVDVEAASVGGLAQEGDELYPEDPDEEEDEPDEGVPEGDPANDKNPGDKNPKKPKKPGSVEVKSVPKKPHKKIEDPERKPEDTPEESFDDEDDDTIKKSPKTGQTLIQEWFGM